MSPSLAYAMPLNTASQDHPMRCNRKLLADLLMQQWKRLTKQQLEQTRYIKTDIARLIEEEYGVHHSLAENYLSNLERSLPILLSPLKQQ